MPKILHTARYTGIPWEILKSVVPDGFTVETLEELSYKSLLRQAVGADYLLVSGRLPIDEAVLSAANHLKMIQRTGVGTEMLDIEAIKRHNIPVYINAGVNARSVAEHTVALMLACLKRLPQINADTHSGVWKKQQQGLTTHELYGKTVALVGMGNIGRTVASLLQPFGVKILYTDVLRQSAEVETKLYLTYCEKFESMLPEADILSFHCPLTPENAGMLNKDTLSLMKDGSVVVNTARGKLINPGDLCEALQVGKIASVALDTHYEEPIKEGNMLSKFDNVILTPHIGGLSYEAFQAMMMGAMENIRCYEESQLELIKNKRII